MDLGSVMALALMGIASSGLFPPGSWWKKGCGINLKKVGSGNIGAANAFDTLVSARHCWFCRGFWQGLLVWFHGYWASAGSGIVMGFLAVTGHIFPHLLAFGVVKAWLPAWRWPCKEAPSRSWPLSPSGRWFSFLPAICRSLRLPGFWQWRFMPVLPASPPGFVSPC